MESDGTDYERLRLENIKRNTEFLESIGIDNVKVMMQTPKKSAASKKGSKKIAHKTRSIPARRSSRITLLSLQNMMEEAKETGNTALLEEAELKLKQLDLPIEDQSPLVVNNQIKEEQVQREFLDDGFMNLLEQMEPTESQKTLLAKTAEYSKLS